LLNTLVGFISCFKVLNNQGHDLITEFITIMHGLYTEEASKSR